MKINITCHNYILFPRFLELLIRICVIIGWCSILCRLLKPIRNNNVSILPLSCHTFACDDLRAGKVSRFRIIDSGWWPCWWYTYCCSRLDFILAYVLFGFIHGTGYTLTRQESKIYTQLMLVIDHVINYKCTLMNHWYSPLNLSDNLTLGLFCISMNIESTKLKFVGIQIPSNIPQIYTSFLFSTNIIVKSRLNNLSGWISCSWILGL